MRRWVTIGEGWVSIENKKNKITYFISTFFTEEYIVYVEVKVKGCRRNLTQTTEKRKTIKKVVLGGKYAKGVKGRVVFSVISAYGDFALIRHKHNILILVCRTLFSVLYCYSKVIDERCSARSNTIPLLCFGLKIVKKKGNLRISIKIFIL